MNLSSSTRTRQCSASIVVSRVSSAILGSVMLTMALTACIGPIKPTPTQQSQEATPPPIETAEAPKPVELAPSDAPPSVSNATAPRGWEPNSPSWSGSCPGDSIKTWNGLTVLPALSEAGAACGMPLNSAMTPGSTRKSPNACTHIVWPYANRMLPTGRYGMS